MNAMTAWFFLNNSLSLGVSSFLPLFVRKRCPAILSWGQNNNASHRAEKQEQEGCSDKQNAVSYEDAFLLRTHSR